MVISSVPAARIRHDALKAASPMGLLKPTWFSSPAPNSAFDNPARPQRLP